MKNVRILNNDSTSIFKPQHKDIRTKTTPIKDIEDDKRRHTMAPSV